MELGQNFWWHQLKDVLLYLQVDGNCITKISYNKQQVYFIDTYNFDWKESSFLAT